MKKFSAVLITLIVLLSCFTFTGCGTKNITKYITNTTYSVNHTLEGQVFFVTCRVNQSKIDLSTVEKIVVKVNGEKVTANFISESGYFTFTYVDEDYELSSLHVDKATATVDKDAADKVYQKTGMSIGGMFLFGLFITLAACVVFWIAYAGDSNITMNVINGGM